MLYEHQVWTCEYLGLTSIGPSQRAELEAWMREDATESLTLHQLLQPAHCWLYERRILLGNCGISPDRSGWTSNVACPRRGAGVFVNRLGPKRLDLWATVHVR
jgi:hypothetical protein